MRSLGFELVDTVFHHVADAHDPPQAAVNHDRRVPDPVLGYDAHDLLNWGLWRNRVHFGCVDLGGRRIIKKKTAMGQRPDDVPLAGNSGEHGAVMSEDESTALVICRRQ